MQESVQSWPLSENFCFVPDVCNFSKVSPIVISRSQLDRALTFENLFMRVRNDCMSCANDVWSDTIKFLKSQLTTQFSIPINFGADFWEFLLSTCATTAWAARTTCGVTPLRTLWRSGPRSLSWFCLAAPSSEWYVQPQLQPLRLNPKPHILNPKP